MSYPAQDCCPSTPFPGAWDTNIERHANRYGRRCRLIFMTYNGWVMVAVTLGAFFGYLVFGAHTPVNKETQCH